MLLDVTGWRFFDHAGYGNRYKFAQIILDALKNLDFAHGIFQFSQGFTVLYHGPTRGHGSFLGVDGDGRQKKPVGNNCANSCVCEAVGSVVVRFCLLPSECLNSAGGPRGASEEKSHENVPSV